MTWLLVEDDPDIRTVVAVMMQLWGETALALPDGNAAWKWLDTVEGGSAHDLPDLALMDIRMPGHTGDQIAARIRQTERLKHIPIILMTAFSLTDAEVNTMKEKVGIDHLIKKPLPDMDDFKTTLYRVRDEKRKSLIAPPAVATPAPTQPTLPIQSTVPSSQPAVSAAPAPTTPKPASQQATAPPVTAPPIAPTPVQTVIIVPRPAPPPQPIPPAAPATPTPPAPPVPKRDTKPLG